MKRTTGLAIAGTILLGLAFLPLPVGGPIASAALRAQFAGPTGLVATVDPAHVRVTFLPFPKARFDNVSVADERGLALARIGAAEAYLRPLDIVGGRLRFNGLSLTDAVIDASTPEKREAWRQAGLKLIDRETIAAIPPPGQIVIAQATALAGREPVTDIAGRIAWDGGSEALSIWAEGRWRGEAAALRLSDLRVGEYLAGGPASPMRLSVRTPFASLESDGVVSGGSAPVGDMAVRLTVSSASGLARWLGSSFPLAGMIERYEFEGRGALSPRGFSSPAATFKAGGSRFEGTLALRVDGERPKLSGTLATQEIDFEKLGAPVDTLLERAGPWSSDPFEPEPLKRTDIDVRLSASKARILGARLEDAAISVILNGGRLEVALGRAQAYQGQVRGRASVQGLDAERIEARLQASFEGLDVGSAMQDVAGRRSLTGRGQGQIQIDSSGGSPTELARNMSGKLAAQVRDGDIGGFSLADAAQRPGRLFDGPVELGQGRTRFQSFAAHATMVKGVADFSEISLANGATGARANGQISIRDQQLQLDGEARAPGLPASGLPFALRGPWTLPEMRWDPLTTFRRS